MLTPNKKNKREIIDLYEEKLRTRQYLIILLRQNALVVQSLPQTIINFILKNYLIKQ